VPIALYVVIGISFAYPAFAKQVTAKQVNTELSVLKNTAETKITPRSGTPAEFIVKRLGIDLLVKQGVYDPANKTWTLDSTHLFVSSGRNASARIANTKQEQPSVVVFYGHNTPLVAAPAKDLLKGDVANVQTKEGQTFSYYFTHDEYVRPDDVSILTRKTDTQEIVLITCAGIWDESRRAMFFQPINAVDRQKE
jgi:LPXTG-site transpeptidase (sortase) family protein